MPYFILKRTKMSRAFCDAAPGRLLYKGAERAPVMLQETLTLMPAWAFCAAAGVALAAGFVKGMVGFALPLVMVSGLSLFLEPPTAIAGILLPAALSNFLQAVRFPRTEIGAAIRDHWRYILIVCVMIVAVAQLVAIIPVRAL